MFLYSVICFSSLQRLVIKMFCFPLWPKKEELVLWQTLLKNYKEKMWNFCGCALHSCCDLALFLSSRGGGFIVPSKASLHGKPIFIFTTVVTLYRLHIFPICAGINKHFVLNCGPTHYGWNFYKQRCARCVFCVSTWLRGLSLNCTMTRYGGWGRTDCPWSINKWNFCMNFKECIWTFLYKQV